MSYQAYLNNIGLQQSLQDTFAQAQTTNDQEAFEEVEDDNENKVARGDTMKEEKEQADEEGAIGLSTALIPAMDISIGGSTISSLANQAIGSVTSAAKSAVSDVVDSVGESISTGISAGLQSGKALLSEAAEGIQNQLGAFAENAKNVFGNMGNGYSSRIGSTDQEYLMEGDPEVAEALGSSSVRAVAPDAAEAAVPTAETLGTTTATVATEAGTVATGTTAAVVGAEAGGEAAAGGLAAIAPELAVGADIPFLNIGIALAGVGYGLYELFHHSSAPAQPPPPPAPLAVAQNVATVQIGV